jgi:hypothetical protein
LKLKARPGAQHIKFLLKPILPQNKLSEKHRNSSF